jgi:hypothetical protein
MRKRTVAIAAAGVVGVAAVSGGIAYAAGVGSESDRPITGVALDRASAAALAHMGGGRVTETEVGDEDSLYEVEVTLGDGRQVDVQLDESFRIVGQSLDEDGTGDADGDRG